MDVVAPRGTLATISVFLEQGIEHILLGVDHLRFVLGRLAIVRTPWMLVETITAFTVAHSITLAIATLGHASVPAAPLNVAIALSILFLGPEIVRACRGGLRRDPRHVAGHPMKPLRAAAAGRPFATALVLASGASRAHAHLIETGLGPVYDGIAHFALTPEGLMPALALAVLAGLRGRDHARRVILVPPLAWLAACLAGILAKVSPPASLSWLPLLVLGGLVAADFRLPIAATTALAAALGIFLGLANGYVMVQAGPGVRGGIGIVGAVFVIVSLGAACAVAWQSEWLRTAWRVAGSWIAASGLLLLGWSLR